LEPTEIDQSIVSAGLRRGEGLRILITGGTGFVGTHLVRFLKSRDSQISVIASGNRANREPAVQYYELDIRDAGRVRTVIRETNPQQLYHLAGVAAVDASWADPRRTYEINVFGALNVFDAAMSLPVPPSILNISTSQIYAPATGILTEESPLRPANPYAASKAMAELLVPQYRDLAGGRIITARPFNHTGPGQPSNFVLPAIAKQFAEMELGWRPPKLRVGNIMVRRDFTDVRDVVRAYAILLEKGRTSELYNVCSGSAVLLSDVIRMFEETSGIEVTTEIDPEKVRTGEISEIYGDPRKLQAETGWNREIPLRKTVEDMLNYWRSQCESQNVISTSG
jgi:GDP-4-dehydro-6-deoxy-D-mannose reductase